MPHNHHDRDDLTGEHKAGHLVQITLAILFLAVWLLDGFWLKLTLLNQYLTASVRLPIGISMLIFSVYLSSRSLAIVFGEKRDPPAVIREGAFNLVRHPMYLSEIVLYLGLLLMSFSLAAAVVWLAGIVFLHIISRYEERLLLARFGEEYERYLRDVPMWVPWPWRRKL